MWNHQSPVAPIHPLSAEANRVPFSSSGRSYRSTLTPWRTAKVTWDTSGRSRWDWAMEGLFGYGSIPFNTYENTIFRVMNIHKSQLFWCELQGYKVLTHCHFLKDWFWSLFWSTKVKHLNNFWENGIRYKKNNIPGDWDETIEKMSTIIGAS